MGKKKTGKIEKKSAEKLEGIIQKYFHDREEGRIQCGEKKYYNFKQEHIKFKHNGDLEGKLVRFDIDNGKTKNIQLQEPEEWKPNEKWLLPKDTLEALDQIKFKVDNYALAQNHYFYQEKKNKKLEPLIYHLIPKAKDNNSKTKEKPKNNQKKEIEEQLLIPASMELLNKINTKNIQIAKAFFNKNYTVISYRPDVALMIGLGGESPYDSFPVMALHPIYGIPYLPASTIKGVLRSFYIIEKFDGKEDKAMENEEFVRIFGCDAKESDGIERKARKGDIIILDAYPQEQSSFYYEKFTPHYSDYYKTPTHGGRKPPSDDGKTNPLSFPAIRDTNFQIIFGFRKKQEESNMEELKPMLLKALLYLGIGGKTAIGYGVGEAKEIKI